MSEQITCIYCRKTTEAPAKGEHIILRGLKGTKTITQVCSRCNGDLSKIDLKFLQDSVIALVRLSIPGARGRLKSTQFFFSSSLDAWMDAVVKTGAICIKPQVAVYEDRLVGRSEDEMGQHAIERFLEAFAAGQLRTAISLDIRENEESYSTTRVVIDVNKKGDQYFLRARTQELADLLLTRLDAEAADLLADSRRGGLETTSCKLPADSTLRITPCIDIINRCAAKMAFNFACHQLGPELLLREEFNPVREYIIGTGVRKSRRVAGPDGEDGLTWDGRFVDFRPSPTMKVPGLPPNQRDGHFIALGIDPTPNGPSLAARVSVYRSVQFAVNLGPMPQDVPFQLLKERLPAIIVTPLKGGGDELRDPTKTPDWFTEREARQVGGRPISTNLIT
jgi:hypothetical protein